MTAIIYLTVTQLCEKHPAFKPGGIRALIFNEETNGLKASGAIVRVGRKVLIDEAKFFAWVSSQSGVAAWLLKHNAKPETILSAPATQRRPLVLIRTKPHSSFI